MSSTRAGAMRLQERDQLTIFFNLLLRCDAIHLRFHIARLHYIAFSRFCISSREKRRKKLH
jgi:hypothetical protein